MNRLLEERHYKLVLPGIGSLMHQFSNTLNECIKLYLDSTKVDYTTQDVAEIQTMYLARYGSKL